MLEVSWQLHIMGGLSKMVELAWEECVINGAPPFILYAYFFPFLFCPILLYSHFLKGAESRYHEEQAQIL